MAKELPIIHCDYCGQKAKLLIDSSELYSSGRNYGPAWFCPCEPAWVGCHDNSPVYKPLGRLANAELRAAKIAAHAMFDPLWKAKIEQLKHTGYKGNAKQKARGLGYRWLADQMGIKMAECHIGMFDVEQCQAVVRICTPLQPNRRKAVPAEFSNPKAAEKKKSDMPALGSAEYLNY